MPQATAIVFDLLTGLLNSWSTWDAAIPTEEQQIADGQKWRKRYLEITYSCGAYKPYEDLVSQAAEDVGLSPASAEALMKRYDEIKPWPEVPEVLARLRKQGYKLAVVTNISNELGHRTIRNTEKIVREQTNVKDFTFDHVVTAEESGFYKPDPKPYRDVLMKLGVEPQDAIFVAGSSSDIPGASNVGMRVCWNNHVGLACKGDLLPMREGSDLVEALGDILL